MTHLNSAVKLLDRAAEKFNDKIAISGMNGARLVSVNCRERKGCRNGTCKDNSARIYACTCYGVFEEKAYRVWFVFMGAMYSANPYVPTARYACEQNTENC